MKLIALHNYLAYFYLPQFPLVIGLLIGFEPKKFVHTGDAAFFLIKIWMYIQIEGRRNIRVSEYYTYGFIIASAFNASGGECMAQSMEHY